MIAVFTCKQHYAIPAKAVKNVSFLVVEGDISVGQDSTIIQLSHVTALSDTTQAIVPENGAVITVESDAGRTFPLSELGNGVYGISQVTPGAATEKYRLNIKTAGSRQYVSGFVEFKKAPPIDSISWEQLNDGVHIYVNAHDDASKSKYYKWSYSETWQYHLAYNSMLELIHNAVLHRIISIYTCWKTIPLSPIELQATTKLAKDVVYKKQLMFIPTSDFKVQVLYSILVRQSVLTPEGYDFWTGLSKNTEQLGSLFDAQPSALAGNIHSLTDSSEKVIGFISASTTNQQRLFIKRTSVINWQDPLSVRGYCDTVHLKDGQIDLLIGDAYIPIDYVMDQFNSLFYAAPIECTDCRTKGGVLAKPSFWP